MSEFAPRDRVPAWGDLDLSLSVDGSLRQSDRCSSMILDPPALVVQLSRWFALLPGDLVFTGTPAGVGPVEPGQKVRAACARLGLEVEFSFPLP
mgnify:CR=1 FL=1